MYDLRSIQKASAEVLILRSVSNDYSNRLEYLESGDWFMGFFGNVVWHILRNRLFDSVRPSLIHFDVYRLKGELVSPGSVFSVLIVGSKMSVEYFAKAFFLGKPTVEFLGRFSLNRVASSLGQLSADLTIVESSWFFSRFLVDTGFFLSPRVDFILDIADSLEVVQSRVARDKRRRLRQVAEAGYTFEVTKDLSKLASFYYDVYLPHMLRRHSGHALPISYSECKELFLKGELLLVKSGEECVSGSLLVHREDELWQPVLGVKDVDTKFTLGSYAIYRSSIVVGIEQGFARMDFGEAPPFMQDGLFKFKKGLGMWVRPALGSSAQVFGVRFSGVGEFVRCFLSVQPFVFVDGAGLSGLVFLECVDDLSVKSFCVPGLAGLYVVSSSVDVSGLKVFRFEALSVEDCLRGGSAVLRFLGRVCVDGKYSLYRITR